MTEHGGDRRATLMDLSVEVDLALTRVLEADTDEKRAEAEIALGSYLVAQSDKVSAVAIVLSRLTRDANNLRDEAALLQAGADRIEADEKRLRGYVQRCMELTGTQQMKSPLVTFSIRPGSESVEIFNADMVPNQYRQEPKTPPPDKTAIKKAILSGKEVPGCRLTTGGPVLSVRYAKSSAEVLNHDPNTLTEAAEAARKD